MLALRRFRAVRRLSESWQNRDMWYVPLHRQILSVGWPRSPFERIDFEDLRRRRRSDTIFVLGSGPSLGEHDARHWDFVRRHDSFGINLSFLLDFVPTYHLLEDAKYPWRRAYVARVLASRRTVQSGGTWFISTRHVARGIHPRCAPEMFPERPRICVFRLPPRLLLDRDRPFRAEDFARAISYRSTMSVVLALILQLGYSRIVLLGVDLDTFGHFYDDLPEMKEYIERDEIENQERVKVDRLPVFPSMIPKGSQYRPFDEYLAALNALHLKPRGQELFVGTKRSILSDRLRYFEEWDD